MYLDIEDLIPKETIQDRQLQTDTAIKMSSKSSKNKSNNLGELDYAFIFSHRRN